MTNLNERLRGIDRLTPPDLWEAARIRAERGTAIAPTPSLTRRFAIIAASLAIGLAAVGVVIFAFRSDPSTTRPVTPARRAVENGDIWVQVGGGDGTTAIYRVDPEFVRGSEAMWTDSGGTFGDTQVAPRLIADDYAFSPDGSRVVFSEEVAQGSGEVPRELFVMNADGTGVRQLTNDGVYAGFPAWSPDGNSIVYASYRGNEYIPGCLGVSNCPTDLYVIDAGGGTPSPVATGDVSETTPTWSPDGSRIAFSEVSDGWAGTIVTMRADGSDRVVLQSAGEVSFPSWSPDGAQIVFLRMQGGTNHLWTVSPDGSEQHDLVDTRTDTNFGRPVWSPEGDHIAFARYAGVVSLWIIDRAGDRSPERIAGWPGFEGSPIAWRPVPVQRESDTENVSLLVSSSGPSGDQALLTGTLTAEDGCLAVSTGTSSVYVVWPAGYSLAEEKGGTWLVNDSGTLVAMIGDEVQMGGGITNLPHAEPEVVGGIPSSCEVGGPDAYWFAGIPALVLADGVAGAVTVPNVVGVQIGDAIRELEELGLAVSTISIQDDSQLGEPGADDVIAQEPAPGTEVVAGTEVSLTVTAMPHSMPATSERRASGGLSSLEVLAMKPLDPQEVVRAGWPATLKEIEARALKWYQREGVADADEADLERAIRLLSEAIAVPPTEEEPAQTLYVHEMIYRREAVCRSLPPENAMRPEYCSPTSVPDLSEDDVPWAS